MGSNMYTTDVVNCNGSSVIAHAQQQGVIMSGNFMGKDQSEQLSHFNSIVTVDQDGLSPFQNSTTTSSSMSSPPSCSPAPQSSATTAKPNDIEQVEDGPMNEDPKNYSSMEHQHPPGARNLAEPQVPNPAQLNPQHSHPLLQQHVPPLPSHHPQHYQPSPSSSQHPSSILNSAMAMGLVDHVAYQLDNPIYRAPPVLEYGVPSHYQHPLPAPPEIPVGPDLSPPSVGKVGGKRRPRKRQKVKTCGVCGDRAKSFHFGGLSCDSCKAFFRRSVQHDAYLAFRCAYENCCEINISTRKSCQYCRFAKSLSIGMEKGWVMTEEERNTLNQQRLEKKHSKTATATSAQPQPIQQPTTTTPTSTVLPEVPAAAASFSTIAPPEPTYIFKSSSIPAAAASNEPVVLALQESDYVADVDKMLDYMSFDEQLEIKSVVETYLHAYKEMPFRVSPEEGQRDSLEIIDMFTTILRRFAFFAKLIPDFAELSREDQGNLLRAAVLEMCLLRGAVCFDTENHRWPSSTMEFLRDCPQLRVEDMQRLVSKELFEMHITFIYHMKKLRIDEPTAMLLIMTVLFSPERIQVDDKVKINKGQEKYLMLLQKYVNWKFGRTVASKIYPQLLTRLSDLRQLNDFHTEFHLNLDRQEVNAIRKSLMELQLNPYPSWKIVPESQHSSPEESRAPSPIPLLPTPSPSMPIVTQALIRSFTDKRIPALLENPYATFETDLGMLRQVHETIGSFFPPAARAAFTTANTQNKTTQLLQNPPESESVGPPTYVLHDPMLSSGEAACSTSATRNPRVYAPPTESIEQVQPLEFLQPSRSQEFPVPNLRDSMTLPISTLSESSLTTLLPGEYHSERLQQFLQHSRSSGGFEAEGVIRGVGASSSSTPSTPLPTYSLIPGSHLPTTTPPTVLRKHSSSRPDLPTAVPSSVIRSAPSSKSSTRAVPIPSVGVIQTLTDDSPRIEKVGQSFRSISTAGPAAGWHGGEVHATTTNGYPKPLTPSSPITVTSRIKSTTSYSDSNDEFSCKKK